MFLMKDWQFRKLMKALCLEGLKKLVELDKEWIPEQEGTSLYIRPFIIATIHF